MRMRYTRRLRESWRVIQTALFQACRSTLHPSIDLAFFLSLGLLDFLHLVARAADGEALLVQQVADFADHQHFMVLVIAPVAAALHGPQLRKFLLPVAQHMGFDAAQIPHLTNGEVPLCGNGWKCVFHENQCAIGKSEEITLSWAARQSGQMQGCRWCGTGTSTSNLAFLQFGLNLVLELVAGVEGHHAARLDGDSFAGTRVAARAGRFGADLKVAKA